MAVFKSGKQRRAEIMMRRSKRLINLGAMQNTYESEKVKVDVGALKPNNSYGTPDFVRRAYYQDLRFCCKDCGEKGVWRADRQKWWYEVLKGDVFTTARRCKACRAKERLRRITARSLSEEGMVRKKNRLLNIRNE